MTALARDLQVDPAAVIARLQERVGALAVEVAQWQSAATDALDAIDRLAAQSDTVAQP